MLFSGWLHLFGDPIVGLGHFYLASTFESSVRQFIADQSQRTDPFDGVLLARVIFDEPLLEGELVGGLNRALGVDFEAEQGRVLALTLLCI